MKAHDAPFIMAIPLILLALGSIFIGCLAKDMMSGLGSCFLGNSIFILPKNIVLLESEYIPQSTKFVPLVFTFFGAFLAFVINYVKTK